jgi:ABC-type transporter Mla subunit MlaD
VLEISKGGTSGTTNPLAPTYRTEPVGNKKRINGIWQQKRDNDGLPVLTNAGAYAEWKRGDKGYWLPMQEAPPLGDRLERVAKQAEEALPNILNLTNRLQTVLDNAAELTSNLNRSVDKLQPTLESVALITGNLRDPKGSLGEWILPTNINTRLDSTLGQLNNTLGSADAVLEVTETNLATVLSNFNLSLISLAGITSNLNAQIGQNSNLVMNIDSAIRNADTLMQGLKKHWFLRSAFKEKKPEEKKTDAKTK